MIIYSEDTTLTAMCLWEYILANSDSDPIAPCLEEFGYAHMRHWVARLAPHCDQAWSECLKDDPYYGESFDWAFVPAWFRDCVSFSYEAVENLRFEPKSVRPQPPYFFLGQEAEHV